MLLYVRLLSFVREPTTPPLDDYFLITTLGSCSSQLPPLLAVMCPSLLVTSAPFPKQSESPHLSPIGPFVHSVVSKHP